METTIYKENSNIKSLLIVAATIMLFIGTMVLSHTNNIPTTSTAIKPMAAWSDSTWTRRW